MLGIRDCIRREALKCARDRDAFLGDVHKGIIKGIGIHLGRH